VRDLQAKGGLPSFLKNHIFSTENYSHHHLSLSSPRSVQKKAHEFHNAGLLYIVKTPGAFKRKKGSHVLRGGYRGI
jgi:hypothetical protein